MESAYIFSTEPFCSFIFVIDGSFEKKNFDSYSNFLFSAFSFQSIEFFKGSVKAQFYVPFSNALNGISFLLQKDLKFNEDRLIEGVLIFPSPGSSIWEGKKFKFTNTMELESILPRIQEEVVSLFSSFLPYKYLQTKSQILVGLNSIESQGIELSLEKKKFIQMLAAKFPEEADPCITTIDGTEVDIFWEKKIVLSLDEDSVAISDFTGGEQKYEYFEKSKFSEAVSFALECYKNFKKLSS